jgi:anti-sigma regulatory factor (Ser/Thr protein kinase)
MTTTGLAHQAFLYDGAEELAEAMAPLVRDALRQGDKVVVAAKRASVEALREELGDAGDAVELHDTLEWHPRPVHRLMAVRQMLDGLPPGRRLLALGEPIWSGSEATRREWARYESAINVALADAPLRFICLYDRSELPDATLAGGAARASDEQYDIPFDGDHHAFRGALAGRALECGIDADRAEELVLAANEVVTNSVRHGEPPIAARCWVADGDFVCEVSDAGAGVPDPFAGWTLPAPGARSGWGLALARRICDALEVSDRAHGSRVRLYVALA